MVSNVVNINKNDKTSKFKKIKKWLNNKLRKAEEVTDNKKGGIRLEKSL